MRAFLSILGLWNHDPTVLDNFKVPQGLNRDTAIKKILFDCAELSLVYTEPEIFKLMVKAWCESNLDNWNRMYKALYSDYDPIHNYNKYEDWTDNRDIKTDTKVDTDNISESDVAGFNENENYVKDNRITTKDKQTGDLKTDDDNVHKGHIYGNIGVTTSQEMLTQEMEIAKIIQVVPIIIESFKNRFCLMVY